MAPLVACAVRHGRSSVGGRAVLSLSLIAMLPAGCGGIKLFDTEYGEIKRMWVRPPFRGRGFGKLMLDHLADYAKHHGVGILRLETGIHQHAAIRLYEREG